MANLMQPLSPDEVKKIGVSDVRKGYNTLANTYNKIIDYDILFCHKCGSFMNKVAFYSSDEYASGYFPICKECLMKMATDYDKKTKTYTDNKDKTKRVFQMMNMPFIEGVYESALRSINQEGGEKVRGTAYQQALVMIKSLPQYRGLTWKDSDFTDDTIEEVEMKYNQKTLKNAKKRFGSGYTNDDYMFLEQEYQDWVTRYECNNKAQEAIVERLSFKKWEINKATKSGLPTKDLDKTYQELLATANIQPRQNSLDAGSDAQTFGTLIQKYEETRPLPEVDEDLKDVDKIGLMIDVFFRGHTSKMLGIKNAFTNIYEKFMSRYTVTKPEYEDEADSETIFTKVFGNKDEI